MGTLRTYVRGVIKAAIAPDFSSAMVRPGLGDELVGLNYGMGRITPDQARVILANAVAGDLAAQHELFGMMLDTWPRLSKATSEISQAVRRTAWEVQAASEGDDEECTPEAKAAADLVRRALRSWRPVPGSHELTFEETLEHMLDARWRGVSVCEILWKSNPQGWLPRASQHLSPTHYGWNPTGEQLGLKGTISEQAVAWQPFVPGKFLVGVHRARAGSPGSTALLRPLVPYWIGRTYGWQWLMRTAQLFGVPIRWATYDASRADVAEQVSSMLRNLGAAGWAAFPDGTKLEIKEAASNVRDNPQAMLMELADQAADLLILGQTLSSTSQASGLGSSTSDLHGQVRREVLTDAAWWIADILSYQLVPAVLELNLGAVDPLVMPVVRPDLSVAVDPKAEAERLEILSRIGIKIPKRWAYEATGIPEPEEGDPVIETSAPAQTPGVPGMPGPTAPGQPGETADPAEPAANAPKSCDGGDCPSEPAEPQNEAFAGVRGRSVFGCPIQAQAFPAQSPVLQRFFEDMTGTTSRWLAPVEEPLHRLMELAQDGAITEADFQKALEEARATLPELFDEVNTDVMATALRRAMASEMVNGAVEGARGRRLKR
jgi:phage gp29-like protein